MRQLIELLRELIESALKNARLCHWHGLHSNVSCIISPTIDFSHSLYLQPTQPPDLGRIDVRRLKQNPSHETVRGIQKRETGPGASDIYLSIIDTT